MDDDGTTGRTIPRGGSARRGRHRADDEPVDQLQTVAQDVWLNLTGAHGYLPVLILTMAAMISIPLLGDSPGGSVFDVLLIGAGLIVTVYRSTSRLALRRLAMGLIAISTVAALVATLTVSDAANHQALLVTLTCTYLILLLLCFPLVLVRSFQHKRVTINTLCATVSAYLLIGLIFMAGYRLMGLLAPPFFTQTAHPTPGQYAYFSFITLTTVGYGDLTAGSDAARSIVMIEAVIGQVFLVTTVARAVSLLGEERRTQNVLLDEQSATRSAKRSARLPTEVHPPEVLGVTVDKKADES